ncbi:MAG: amidohydrolase [Prevotellaceae bacterium]|jgi:predicted amidohydrolase|nr:amidohydrolase [Prevotellaceae bacterium]
MRITLLQTDIVWENKQANLHRLHPQLESLAGTTDLVLLPETFSTGFSMESNRLAEPNDGHTLTALRQMAARYQFALAGSHIATDRDAASCYNRAFFITPEGDEWFYDKRHLFRMGRETESFTAGTRRTVITYRGWHILLLVCYDLRFPVWSRNVCLEYDLLLYTANWPASRRAVWDTLLPARALENMSYVCGVNRVGTDGEGLLHDGGSVAYSFKGEPLASIPDNEEAHATIELDLNALQTFRRKFPAWKEADNFTLH